ncbi:hypothetical protein L21SP5_02147 [Salinivirga cyanobacteriivorans]|uniref:DUF354 domain-containing protein n=1 Tax=Salinivirga cyanobacteriivorans TaxID=1307839 RepID=A0A0S2I0E1_9BACT|nr:DUF354 domain-containing protein [Salinivirga cyanobacteriivorans]ALO15780.1 hypothetical protein L21SP5_02147 [Salinivirga cyanobacteriivorans]
MKILIDIGHPAHIHCLKGFAREMISKGHEVLFTYRNKEFIKYLLDQLNFKAISLGRKHKSTIAKMFGMVKFDLRLYRLSLRFRPDMLVSLGSIYASHAAFLIKRPHITLEDTYNFEQVNLYKPFTKYILTGNYEHPLKSEKVIKYSGYHELAYLHPNRFTPDKNVLLELGVSQNEPYTIMRFVSWNASHDRGHWGMSLENKINAVKEFEGFGKVFISSEGNLPEALEEYRLPIEPDRIHDAMAFASLIFGESSTMVEEGAMLGIPGVYLFNQSTYYTRHLEKEYKLLYNYSESKEDQISAIEKGKEILQNRNVKREWQQKREKLLLDKIDVTAFMVWFIENYPESPRIMKENPDYQYRFK